MERTGSQDVLRVGFIGAGGICRDRHLPGLAGIDGVRVVAVCNRSEASGRQVAESFGIDVVLTDWQALLAREDVDAVFIGTWPYMHKPMVLAALAAGKHVFCQARMAMDLDEAKDMLAAAQQYPHLVSMICPPPHRMPYEPYIKQVLADGVLGTLYAAQLVCVNGSDLGPLNWRQRREYSGQQIMQVGIWAETLNAWLGPYQTLAARFATPIAHKPDPLAGGESYAVAIPQVVSVQGTLTSGLAISEYHCGVAAGESVNALSLYGEKGAMQIALGQPLLMARSGEALAPVEVPEALRRDWSVERDFVDAVRLARQGAGRQQRPVSPDFVEGFAYMKKMHALHLSAKAGKTVNLAVL